MKFLMDKSPAELATRLALYPDLILGQFITPLTRYRNAGGVFAIDNGAFTRFKHGDFSKILVRDEQYMDNCLFVAIPDIVGNARRTMEIWNRRSVFSTGNWPLALVAQNGMEDFDIPWCELDAIFIGGEDPWKDSRAVMDIVKTAKTLGKHVHIGRVNEIKRYERFCEAGADTCDGSGVARYSHMLEKIRDALSGAKPKTLFDEETDDCDAHVCDPC